jgi:hypothetical protein
MDVASVKRSWRFCVLPSWQKSLRDQLKLSKNAPGVFVFLRPPAPRRARRVQPAKLLQYDVFSARLCCSIVQKSSSCIKSAKMVAPKQGGAGRDLTKSGHLRQTLVSFCTILGAASYC